MQGVSRFIGSTLLLGLLMASTGAMAQGSGQQTGPVAPDRPVEAKGVGISGGIIAGAEVVLLTEAIIDVKPTWAWWVFPILGAGGGGVGGYFLEKNSPEGAVAMLVTSMALLIPTAVAVSVATAYDPEDDGASAVSPGGDGAFSFELNPTESSGDVETYTEVESRPDEIPEGGDTPAPEQPEPAPEPEATPTPEPESPGGHTGILSTSDIARADRAAHLASGSLFHLGSNMSAGFGIPVVDVRPTSFETDGITGGTQSGLEVHIPLLRVDLP